ncbi:MAG TPA: hypothetical protein VMH33_04805 [Solirubrobacterales bacterium]|nr:hypothetical protein [Solirubrobacterales bacterium]
MQLLCPECCSEEVGPHLDPSIELLRCGNCGAEMDRDEALVMIAEAESGLAQPVPEGLFVLDVEGARAELSDPDGAIRVVDPYSDADELHRLLDDAQEKEIVRSRLARATILVYPLSIAEPDPILAVHLGDGPTLLGFEQKLRRREDDEPLAFTVRVLEEMVDEANSLAAGRAADGVRLDRIAAFLNRPGQWNGGDVCEFLAEEIVASGRRLLDADE